MQGAALPVAGEVQYSGIPRIGGNIVVESHNVTLDVGTTHVDVSSLTLVRNQGGAGQAAVFIPRHRAAEEPTDPTFEVTATWANAPMKLGADGQHLRGSGTMVAGGSYALRINYRVPIGAAGRDRLQRLAAYDLTSNREIGTLMVAYRTQKADVFNLPSLRPSRFRWQVDTSGSFLRRDSYRGDAGVSTIQFYTTDLTPVRSGGE
jgi:hypothetical protein